MQRGVILESERLNDIRKIQTLVENPMLSKQNKNLRGNRRILQANKLTSYDKECTNSYVVSVRQEGKRRWKINI